MNQMINSAFIAKEIENYCLYEDNDDCRGLSGFDWIEDADYVHDVCLQFSINGIAIEDHPLLYGEMTSVVNTMDLEELYAYIEQEADRLSYDPWKEHCNADFYGI